MALISQVLCRNAVFCMMTPAVPNCQPVMQPASFGNEMQPATSSWVIATYCAVHGFWPVGLSTGRLGASH